MTPSTLEWFGRRGEAPEVAFSVQALGEEHTREEEQQPPPPDSARVVPLLGRKHLGQGKSQRFPPCLLVACR